ncbi:MAG TPA: hypothetical protein VEK15_09945 [Vicinamibacteria bacterium]|nr:hypothetical protein [Vicinamibacteria bacterium]
MRALSGWIVGILGLGLAMGSIVFRTSAESARDGQELTTNVANLPAVDCGNGREAIVEQVLENGATVARIRCRALERASAVAAAPRLEAPVRVVEATPAQRSEPAPVTKESSRSLKDSVLIIGGAAGAGAGIGAIAGGKKGAALGAAIGGVTGTVYDLSTRKKK